MTIYYSPEEFGLQEIAEVEWSEPCWSFDTTVVWKKIGTKNVYYWASDSGCSCPAPFEDYTKLEDLEKGTKAQACKYLQDSLEDAYDKEYASGRVFDAIASIRAS